MWTSSTSRSTPKRRSIEVISGGQDLITLGDRQVNARAYVAAFQLLGCRSGEEVRHAVGRRAQPPAPGPRPEGGGQRAAAGRADQRHRREHAAGAGGRSWRISPDAPSSFRTTAGSSTVSPRTSFRSRATRRWSSTRAPTSEYEAWKKAQGGDTQPHRVKYKKLIAD